jgi:hypothetical protein
LDAYLLGVVGIVDVLLVVILFAPVPYISPSSTGPSWIPLTVIYGLVAIAMAAFLRFGAVQFGSGPAGPPYGGGYVVLFLFATAFAIIVAFTALYSKFAVNYDNLKGLYAAMGALATVQTPPQNPTTAGVIGVTQEAIDVVFISGIVAVALGRAFNR